MMQHAAAMISVMSYWSWVTQLSAKDTSTGRQLRRPLAKLKGKGYPLLGLSTSPRREMCFGRPVSLALEGCAGEEDSNWTYKNYHKRTQLFSMPGKSLGLALLHR